MSLKDILLHLRIPFSVFLLPIYFLSVGQQTDSFKNENIWLFVILHIFIYPASNAFNSYCDKDEGSIGGLKIPPKVDGKLLIAANIFDFMGLFLVFVIFNFEVFSLVLLYVSVSRAYSWPGIRLKKRPILSWLVVGFFQGAFIFLLVYAAGQRLSFLEGLHQMTSNNQNPMLGALFSSLLLWSIYPITQVYQHDSDAKAGDTTMSMILGKKGTFINTILLFSMASGLSFFFLNHKQFMLFLVLSLPIALFTLWWFKKVIDNPANANFENTMRMNLLSSCILNVCFGFFLFI
jgi:1,4-dihydroxy-2-naphthoate octaprenyltransferase